MLCGVDQDINNACALCVFARRYWGGGYGSDMNGGGGGGMSGYGGQQTVLEP
jgi:hypothetical protein